MRGAHYQSTIEMTIFWSGIKPASLCKSLERELKVSLSWVDLSCPPPLEEVVKIGSGSRRDGLRCLRTSWTCDNDSVGGKQARPRMVL